MRMHVGASMMMEESASHHTARLLVTVVCRACNGRKLWSLDSFDSSALALLSKSLEKRMEGDTSTTWHLEQVYGDRITACRGWPDSSMTYADLSNQLSSGGEITEELSTTNRTY